MTSQNMTSKPGYISKIVLLEISQSGSPLM